MKTDSVRAWKQPSVCELLLNKNFLGAALLLSFGAIASAGCGVDAGSVSEMGKNQAAMTGASDPPSKPDTTHTASLAKGKIPSNCKPNGGHDPGGGKMYYCKDATGGTHLCDEESIKAQRPPCTAAAFKVWDVSGVNASGL